MQIRRDNDDMRRPLMIAGQIVLRFRLTLFAFSLQIRGVEFAGGLLRSHITGRLQHQPGKDFDRFACGNRIVMRPENGRVPAAHIVSLRQCREPLIDGRLAHGRARSTP